MNDHEERCADTVGRTGLDDLIEAIRSDVERADAKPLQRVGAGVAKVHFSSATEEWPTPRDFYDDCVKEFGPFDLDPCATPENAKAVNYYTRTDDGLSRVWWGRVWMNPPYGRGIGLWMKKALEQSQRDSIEGIPDVSLVVCLVPARTDTAWWHDYAAKGTVRFLRGRLRFEGGKYNAPFPSALVVFGLPNASPRAL